MKTLFYTVSLGLFLLLTSCSFVSSEEKNQKVWISHDVMIENLSIAQSAELTSFDKDPSSTCEQHLQKITCISAVESAGYDSRCSSQNVTPSMLKSLSQVYFELPDFHKKVFCHMNRIQIHTKIPSIGYVSITYDSEGYPNGSMMGLKFEMLDAENNNQSISWKEQLNFGLTDLNDPKRQPTAGGPFVEEKVLSAIPRLYAVVVHEMNHLIDMFNGVNSTFESCTPVEGQNFLEHCLYAEGSFPTLSWDKNTVNFVDLPPEGFQYEWPKPSWVKKYPLLSRLCYYYCNGNFISPSLIPQTYQQLYESPFLTGYSTSSEMEDFAESAMIWVLLQTDRPMNYVITDGSQQILYESHKHIQNKVVQAKLNWLKNFFNRKDLEYKFK